MFRRPTFLALFCLLSVQKSLASLCTPTITDIETEYTIPDLGKLAVIGFQASVDYVYLPAGT
jgi:hypothetical protein